MPVILILALFGVGLAVGFVSGLIGIGGGVLIVPFLYFFYAHPAWGGGLMEPSLVVVVAHATSLFIIVPTAIRGVWAYHRARLVAWRAVLPIALSSVAAAVAGARLALVLPESALKLGFGVLLVGSAVRMIRARGPASAARTATSLVRCVVAGLLVGLLSALLGVGGGIIAIPLLIHVVGIGFDRVAASSLAIVMFAAASGVTTYVASGWGMTGLPPGSLGYVHVLAAVPMLVGSTISVTLGVYVNRRIPGRGLRWIFAILLFVLGVQLIAENVGAFS